MTANTQQLELEVLESAAGFYIGTFDPNEGPVSRESVEYWPTRKKAETALTTNLWTRRLNP